MTVDRVSVGEVLRLDRRPIQPDPTQEYTTIGIRSFGKGIFHYEPSLGSQLGKLRFFKLQPDCLVISNIKGWEGAIAVSTKWDADSLASSRFLTYVPIDGRIDVRWARWFFLSEEGNELIQRASPGSADRNRTLAIERFEALEIPLPPIDHQRRIARFLDTSADASSLIADLTLRAEKLREALAVSLTTRPDLSQDDKRRGGWRSVPFGEIAVLDKDEVTVESSASYDIAGVYSFGRGLLRRGPIEGSQTSYRTLHRLHAGQVVMSRLKAWEGAIAVVPESFNGSFVSPEFPTFKVDQASVRSTFLEAVLTSEAFWGGLKGASHGIGARRERVGADRLLEQRLWLPPIRYQDQVLMRIEALDECRVQRRRSAALTVALGPASMNKAFAGLRQRCTSP